jgi:hypothetical protein
MPNPQNTLCVISVKIVNCISLVQKQHGTLKSQGRKGFDKTLGLILLKTRHFKPMQKQIIIRINPIMF